MTHLWTTGAPAVDAHVGFRAAFDLADATQLRACFSASWWATLLLDGEPIAEGPPRAPAATPEYVEVALDLPPGPHVLAFHAIHPGLATERASVTEPHLWVDVSPELRLDWHAAPLVAFRSGLRRLNDNLGFVEWCDTRELPAWTTSEDHPPGWLPAVPVHGLPVPTPDTGAPVSWAPITATLTDEGHLVERLLLLADDPAAALFARGLAPDGQVPPDGVWARFDLGRVRLGRPAIEVTAPAGAGIDLVYCEDLVDGRATPWISMSNGLSANLDHYAARGGRQLVGPASPRGGRWVEVHVLGDPAEIRIHGLCWTERTSAPTETVGRLTTGNELLDRIWQVGVDTLRACSEDAIVDCPVRERGQWLGDAVVGMEIAAVSHGDLRIISRSLRTSAACADDEGFVAGQGPGATQHLASYSALWPGAVLRHATLTGDDTLLTELAPAAARNAAAFCARIGSAGIEGPLPWPFVDWGAGGDDLPISLLALEGLEASARWLQQVEHTDVATVHGGAVALREVLEGRCATASLGYHAASLALRNQVVSGAAEVSAVRVVLDHLRTCFPVDPSGPRLSSHLVTGSRFVTPYFLHFSLIEVARRGHAEEVLTRVQQLYGWLLDQGATTWWENFDPRWSRCHQWAGTPTWLLSRLLLGIWVESDGGLRIELFPGSLGQAAGRVPLPGGGTVDISWEREDVGVRWTAVPSHPLTLQQGNDLYVVEAGERLELILPA